jgi:deoxyribodipyrimidine photolyase
MTRPIAILWFRQDSRLADNAALAAAGIALGRDYPEPIVDHAQARARALAMYRGLADEGVPRD